ncbi:MAG TPA: glycosyltransferase family 39 protein [Candidatus Limnocylindrales bacterium]|jgi:hypothetical protein
MGPIGVALAAVQAALALALLFVLPGLLLGPLVLPGAPTPLHVVGRAIGLSLLIVVATCAGLAAAGILEPVPLAVTLVAITVAPTAHPGVRRSLGRVGRAGTRRRRWWIGGLLGLGVIAITVVLPSIAAAGGDLIPRTSTPWYYVAIARAVADAGTVPATVAEWGGLRPFPTDYLPATFHAAAGLELLPGDLLTAVATYRLALLVAAAIVATLLFRRWFSSWTSLLGACLLLATVRLAQKFEDLRPETFGLVLALFAIWAADRAMADRSRRSVAVAIAAGTATFLSHAEVFLLLGPALVGLAAARSFVGESRRWGLRLPRLGQLWPVGVAAGVLVASVLLGAGLNAVAAGEFRLVGYVAASRAPLAAIPADRVPAGWSFSDDPTWDFYVASVAPALDGQPPPSNFFGSTLLPRSILDVWPGLDARGRGALVTLALLLIAPLLAWPWLDRRRRRFLVTWWMYGLALLAGSWLLFTISSTYVPARVGPRRLMPYELIVPVASAIVLLFLLDRAVRPAWHRLLPRRGPMLAAGALLALLTVGATAPPPGAGAAADQPDEPALTAVGYGALRWIDENLPADARILANAYTDGSMLAVARRSAILDGRAVYLEHPDFLRDSTSKVLGARVLFADPDGDAAARYLADEDVSYVLVATHGPDGNDLGGYQLFDTDPAALAGSGRYTLVRSFGDGRLLLYRVQPPT